MDSNPYQTPGSELDAESAMESESQKRKKLVPLWIKVFGWLFIVMGATAPFGYAYTVLTKTESGFMLLGLEATGATLSFTGVFLMVVFLSLGVSAYGLLFGKSWGVKACLFTGYIGVCIAVYSMVSGLLKGGMEIRLELLIQIPYLIKLHKIRAPWLQHEA